jgi:hypothetical protein
MAAYAAVEGNPPPSGGTVFSGEVSHEWIAWGTWLSQAAAEFADPFRSANCQTAAEKFSALNDDGETVESFLSCNTTGEAGEAELIERLTGQQRAAWEQYQKERNRLQKDLKRKLNNGLGLVAFGRKDSPAGSLEWIPVEAWRFLRLDPEQPDVVRGEGVAYWHVRVIDLSRHRTATPPDAVYSTGLPGRPTSKKLIMSEMERRATAGEMIRDTVKGEAMALIEWLRKNHPRAPVPQPKTLQNSLAEQWRALGGKSIPKRNQDS